MRMSGFLAALVTFSFLLFAPGARADPEHDAPTLEGTWTGLLKLGKGDLRAVFHISKYDNGYVATMDSPDQGAFGVNCSQVALEAGNVRIVVAGIRAEYAGKLSADGNEITGHWQQGGGPVPLTLTRTHASLVPQSAELAYAAALLALSALFLRLACSLCRAATPSWLRSLISVVLVAGLAYFTADFTAYLIMRSMQDVILQIPPWYSYHYWFHEPIALKWIIISHAGPLRYLPFVFALCAAGTLQVIVLQAEVTFRFGLLIVLLQWGATAIAGYLGVLLLEVVIPGAMLRETPVAHVSHDGKDSDPVSLQVARHEVGAATHASGEYAEKAWHNLIAYADPYLDDVKTQLAPLTRHLPEPVQNFLDEGGWWAVFGVLAVIALIWLRSLVRRLIHATRSSRPRKKKKRIIPVGLSLKEDLAEIGPAFSDEPPDRVLVRGLPARLRLVILANGTQGGDVSEAMADRILDWIKPGLAAATAADTPAIRVWPPFYSADGFASACRAHVGIPEPAGAKSHWIILAGSVTMGKSIIHVGLAFHADEENNVRFVHVPSEQWLTVLSVKHAPAAV